MPTKISETLSLAGGHLARPSRFTVLIAPPPEVVTAANSKVFDVLCKNVKVPDITMEPIDISYSGHQVKIPSRVKQDQTIEVTIYLDEHHNLRQLFADWISACDQRFYAVPSAESANLLRSKNIFGNMMIKVRDFNETSQEPMNYLIEGIYPTAVSGPEFGAASVGEVSEITISFAFYRFLSNETEGNYDDIDEFLDVVGQSPAGEGSLFGSLANFGQIGNVLGQVESTYDKISDSFGSLSSTADKLTDLF